jgi:hypothetical protein
MEPLNPAGSGLRVSHMGRHFIGVDLWARQNEPLNPDDHITEVSVAQQQCKYNIVFYRTIDEGRVILDQVHTLSCIQAKIDSIQPIEAPLTVGVTKTKVGYRCNPSSPRKREKLRGTEGAMWTTQEEVWRLFGNVFKR